MRILPISMMGLLLVGVAPSQAAEIQIYKRGSYVLDFRDPAGRLQPALADRMVDTFFAIYPRLTADFNPEAPQTVQFVIDPAYDGVAMTSAGAIVYNPGWFDRNPNDIDVVTHELMHVVQAYGPASRNVGGTPGWLVEGIADYARARYGVDNAGAGWALPEPTRVDMAMSGYRVTARFLMWLETRGHPGIVRALDAQLRDGTYSSESWTALASRSLDDLWADYVADPALGPAT